MFTGVKVAKSYVSVLDIGSSRVSVLVGTSGINSTFIIKGQGEASYAGFGEGEFYEPEKLGSVISAALTRAEENAGFAIRHLYVGIPAEFCNCVCKTISSNFAVRKKITEDVLSEHYEKSYEDKDGQTLISCNAIYNILDDGKRALNPVGCKTTKITSMVSLIYAEDSVITSINKILQTLGIERVTYVSSSLCEAKYVLEPENRTGAGMLIDIGYITSSVAVVRGEGLLMLNSFSLGGGHIMADLAECLNISFSDAEQLKRKIVLSLSPSEKDYYEIPGAGATKQIPIKMANEIVMARLDMICTCIQKCISLYAQETADYIPLFLTGGGVCYIKGAKDYIAKRLGRNIELAFPPLPELNKPSYSSILGLLSHAIKEEEKNKISFLAKLLKR